MTTPSRWPAGISFGGRFAPQSHTEVDISLVDVWDSEPVTDAATDGVELDELLDDWVALKGDRRRVAAAASIGRPATADELSDINARTAALLDRFAAIASGMSSTGHTVPDAAGLPWNEQDAPGDDQEGDDGTRGVRYATSPFVVNGGVADRVMVVSQDFPAGMQFHRRRDGVYPDWPSQMRFQASRPLSPSEMRRAAGLIGYSYAAGVRGEPLGEPRQDTPYSFVVSADSTKTRRDDIGEGFEDFERALPGLMSDGSPVRKTDRAGAGTKGTRLVDGIGDPGLRFEIYYDSVVEH